MPQIKNIIFDLGGIFLDIHFHKTEEAFAKLGIENFNALYNQHHASELFELLETGKITPQIFYEQFRKKANINLSDEQIQNAWNALIGNFSMDSLQWLEQIKDRCNIYLFSNTNKIHHKAFTEIFRKQTAGKNFDDYFIATYYSFRLGLRKPYPASFLKVIENEKLIAEETLFIDDTLKNIEGANQAGLQTIHLLHPLTVLDLDL